MHGQIDRLGDGYTSFCTVNDSINCDRVLASSYARLMGIPVAWLALAAYLAMAALFAQAARVRGEARHRLLGLGAAGVLGSLVFSAYMGVVSVVRLETVCLLCMTLYGVALLNTGLVLAALRSAAGSDGRWPLSPAAASGIVVASSAAMVGLAWWTWPSSSGLAEHIRTAEDVREADPDFYSWFTALPQVDLAGILRKDQKALADGEKVVIVDFFDLQCAHCKRNYYLVKELAARRPGQIEVVHRHFPLDATCNDVVPISIHPNACRAAEALECAGLQGKHDEMLDILFRSQSQLFAENLVRLGGKIGLDTEELDRCVSEHRTLPMILADARTGAKLDIQSTPTVFVGRRRIQGALEEVDKYEMAVLIEASSER